MAKDPIGFAGGDTNLYAYCAGDPVGLVDPSGTLTAEGVYAFWGFVFSPNGVLGAVGIYAAVGLDVAIWEVTYNTYWAFISNQHIEEIDNTDAWIEMGNRLCQEGETYRAQQVWDAAKETRLGYAHERVSGLAATIEKYMGLMSEVVGRGQF